MGWGGQMEDGPERGSEPIGDGSSDDAADIGLDGESDQDPSGQDERANLIRPEAVARVLQLLAADAQRSDGELQRKDINRVYLRKQLSIAECMEVETKLAAAGYKVIGDDDDDYAPHAPEREGAALRNGRYLSKAQEKELGRQIQLAARLPMDSDRLDPSFAARIRRDADRARATFVASNVRYVQMLARRLGKRQNLTLEDLMQEGFIGLLRATELYDPEREFRFKTYATWWIEQRMHRAIADHDRTIRLPVHLREKMMKIRRARWRLTLATGRPPNDIELAQATGIDSERLMKLLWRVQATNVAEGDRPIDEDTDTTLLSLVADDAPSQFDLVSQSELHKRSNDALATLTPREARILRMRFGLGLDRNYTLESIGRIENLTRERIRQIEAKALKTLRHSIRGKLLKSFLDS